MLYKNKGEHTTMETKYFEFSGGHFEDVFESNCTYNVQFVANGIIHDIGTNTLDDYIELGEKLSLLTTNGMGKIVPNHVSTGE